MRSATTAYRLFEVIGPMGARIFRNSSRHARRGRALFEVPDDRLSDDGHERIDLGTSRLGATDRQTVVLPIDVVKAQRGDLTGPEAIDRQQQENRAVSDVRRVIGRRVLDQPIDVLP